MRDDPRLVSLLRCLDCRSELRLGRVDERADDGHVMRGALTCTACGSETPIVRGVPRFVDPSGGDAVTETVTAFGFEWRRAAPRIRGTPFMDRETFLGFIEPVTPEFFEGKTVLDAGCGSGRFTRHAAEFGASAVVAIDMSDAVDVTFDLVRDQPHVLVAQADIFALPLAARFDYVFSVGVLHHTADPPGAFHALTRRLRPGGSISAWVYGRENNGWIVHVLNPLRTHVTSRLPRPLLLGLSYALTVPLHLVLRLVYRPVGRSERLGWLRRRLFYFEYLDFLGRFGFHEQAFIVFDHLVPTLAAYIPHDEFRRWFADAGLADVRITDRARNSWRGFGTLPPGARGSMPARDGSGRGCGIIAHPPGGAPVRGSGTT